MEIVSKYCKYLVCKEEQYFCSNQKAIEGMGFFAHFKGLAGFGKSIGGGCKSGAPLQCAYYRHRPLNKVSKEK